MRRTADLPRSRIEHEIFENGATRLNFKPDHSGLKIGPYWIRAGLSRTNAATVLFASFVSIAMTVFISLIQPYVLNEMVRIPTSRQGMVTGTMVTIAEVISICLMGLVGAWADRVGRRIVFVIGFCITATGYLLFSFASSEFQLYLFRALFAVGLSMVPVMLSISVQDTPQELSRGKWIATNNILQGLGILFIATFILGSAPEFFQNQGYEPVMAGRLSFWSAALLCLFAAAILWLGLPPHVLGGAEPVKILPQFLAGLNEARHNPRLAVAFCAAFIGRGDLVIIGSFLTLWVTQYGIESGLDTATATGQGFKLFGIVQVAALGWAAFMGVIADRINRMTAVCIALAIATIGYSVMGQMSNPMGPSAIPLAILLGIGEISVIIAGGSLLGQEAKASLRGAVIGAFNLFGAVGIVVASGVGGWVFDHVERGAPFQFMGLLNGILLLVAIMVRISAGTPVPQDGAERVQP